MDLQFVIGPAGAVADAKVTKSTVDDAALQRCVVAAVKEMTFPKPKGGAVVIVKYPLVLAP